jgi:hypothetical protein
MYCIVQKKWYKLNGVFNYIQLISKKKCLRRTRNPKRSFGIIGKDGVLFLIHFYVLNFRLYHGRPTSFILVLERTFFPNRLMGKTLKLKWPYLDA